MPTSIHFTSAPITIPPTGHTATSPIGPIKTHFITCTHYDEDPDRGVTLAFCLYSGSKHFKGINTSVTPGNSCAFTTLPGGSDTAPTQTIIVAESSICSICSFVGLSETCTSIQGRTPNLTSTPPPTTTRAVPFPTKTAKTFSWHLTLAL
jgi:hypothetical protein